MRKLQINTVNFSFPLALDSSMHNGMFVHLINRNEILGNSTNGKNVLRDRTKTYLSSQPAESVAFTS